MRFFKKEALKMRLGILPPAILFTFLSLFSGNLLLYLVRNSEIYASDKAYIIEASVLFTLCVLGTVIFMHKLISLGGYYAMLEDAKKIGDTDTIGAKLAKTKKSKLTSSGELRFNESILYFNSNRLDYVKIISPKNIVAITMKQRRIRGKNNSSIYIFPESNYASISTKKAFKKALKELIIIPVKNSKAPSLLKKLREFYIPYLKDQDYDPIAECPYYKAKSRTDNKPIVKQKSTVEKKSDPKKKNIVKNNDIEFDPNLDLDLDLD